MRYTTKKALARRTVVLDVVRANPGKSSTQVYNLYVAVARGEQSTDCYNDLRCLEADGLIRRVETSGRQAKRQVRWYGN